MTRTPSNILSILELADGGKFQEAALQASRQRDGRLAHLEPLFRMLGRSFDAEAPTYAGWRSYLSRLAEVNEAEVVFSSISDGEQPFDWRNVKLETREEANGHLRADRYALGLWTIGEGRVVASTPRLPTLGSHVALHLWAGFTSNINDSFFVALLHEDRAVVSLRFGASQVAIVTGDAEPTLVSVETRSTKLYTLALAPDQITLLVNGSVRARVALASPLRVDQARLELIGDPSCDLGAFPAALELWSGESRMADLTDPAESLIGAVLDEMLETNKSSALYALLRNLEGLDLRRHEDRLLALLDNMLERRCYVPWIFDCFLSHVSEKARQRWRSEHESDLPRQVVVVERLRIRFSRNPHRALSIARLWRRSNAAAFNVLEDVDFGLFDGDILGIIGENGAGKSTLLRALAGLVPISAGRIQVFGKHMLLSAGMGMRPEMSGRENIYLGGCFMGMTPREMDSLVPEIVQFAELEEAIDRPFKYYSDGMKARLVFSLATSVSPDILMLDELLGAGDIRFQKKAADRMHELIARANLVIVVTHGLHFVREHCNKALYLCRGQQRFFGEPEEAIARYLSDLHIGQGQSSQESQETALHQVIVNQLNSAQQFAPDVSA